MTSKVLVLYDGECPICSRYGDYVRLRQRHELTLLDAREHPETVRALQAQGHDINDGMIVVLPDGSVRQGADAVRALDALTTATGRCDVFARRVTRSPLVLAVAYPVAKLVRRLALLIRRIPARIRTH